MSLEAQRAITGLLARRGPGKTICPSEAARMISGERGDWRAHMKAVHAAVDAMAEAQLIELSWKGERLDRRRGAYRIARRQTSRQEQS